MTDSHNASKELVWLENDVLNGATWDGLPAESRVWLYTADRVLTAQEREALAQSIDAFIVSWAAHGKSLQSSWRLEGGRCLMIGLDESSPEATGCSIDSKVHWLQALGEQMGLDWMGRSQVIHYNATETTWVESSLPQFWAQRKAGQVGAETPLVNGVITNKLDCDPSLVVPFEKSWHEEMWR